MESPVHPEHFEYTHVRGGTIPFYRSPQMGGNGGADRGAKKKVPGTAGPRVRFASLNAAGVGVGVMKGGGGGDTDPTQKPTPPAMLQNSRRKLSPAAECPTPQQ